MTESHNAMLHMSSCSGHCWLYILLIVLGGAVPGLAGLVSAQAQTPPPAPQADPDNAEQVALGQQVYASFCAGCHGGNLEGQPNWRQRLPLGNFPAPPHDESGHTWHHADQWLFELVKYGGKYHAPPRYRSAMPAYQELLSDAEIWAVLGFIKSPGQRPSGRSRRSRKRPIAKRNSYEETHYKQPDDHTRHSLVGWAQHRRTGARAAGGTAHCG